jgi:hypothetical protein
MDVCKQIAGCGTVDSVMMTGGTYLPGGVVINNVLDAKKNGNRNPNGWIPQCILGFFSRVYI